MNATVLIADDDPSICTVLSQALKRKSYQVMATSKPDELMDWILSGQGDAVITDVLMPGGNGLDLLPRIKMLRPLLPVIVISAQNSLLTAVKANELGAFDYHPKPFDLNVLLSTLEKSLALPLNKSSFPGDSIPLDMPLVGRSPAMQEIYRTMARLTGVDLTVVIEGESGTGKELVARALHALGKRKKMPFVAVNMSAIPKELVESELFGHEKGAFTGATSRKAGTFEQAEGGTLFLDEIGDMPLEAQTKLLRVLQQGEYTPVGGNRSVKSNVRIVCATHRDLAALVKLQHFREDLFFRLHVVSVRVPPLRARQEDIPELAQYFLRKGTQRGLNPKTLEPEAIAALTQHSWPGNVRELENLIYRLMALYAEPAIGLQAVKAELAHTMQPAQKNYSLAEMVREHLKDYFAAHQHIHVPPGLHERIIASIEKPLIELTLRHTGGNQIKAAKLLGLNRNTLRKKMHDLDIQAKGNNG